eukprot:349641-Chlamydomonas_euryale.AAC.9
MKRHPWNDVTSPAQSIVALNSVILVSPEGSWPVDCRPATQSRARVTGSGPTKALEGCAQALARCGTAAWRVWQS